MFDFREVNWHKVQLWIGALRLPFVFGVGAILTAIQRGLRKRKQEIAEGWSSIEGCIQFASVECIEGLYRATLEYTYHLDEYHIGKYTQDFSSQEKADDFVRVMKDKKIQIRYNPSKPDKSLLEDSDVQQVLPPDSSPVQSIP